MSSYVRQSSSSQHFPVSSISSPLSSDSFSSSTSCSSSSFPLEMLSQGSRYLCYRTEDEDADVVLVLGCGSMDPPVLAAQRAYMAMHRADEEARRMLLIFSGGVGRFTKALLDMVEAEGMEIRESQGVVSSSCGEKEAYVRLEGMSGLVGREKRKLLVDEEQMMRYNERGGDKSEVEALLTEADVFLEIFLNKLKVMYRNEKLPPIRLLDRHSVPSDLRLEMGLTIMLESGSTNTGENIMLSLDILNSAGFDCKSYKTCLIDHPLLQRRAYCVFVRHFGFHPISCPTALKEVQDMSERERREVLETCCGEFRRLVEYSRRGFFDLPDDFPFEFAEEMMALRA